MRYLRFEIPNTLEPGTRISFEAEIQRLGNEGEEKLTLEATVCETEETTEALETALGVLERKKSRRQRIKTHALTKPERYIVEHWNAQMARLPNVRNKNLQVTSSLYPEIQQLLRPVEQTTTLKEIMEMTTLYADFVLEDQTTIRGRNVCYRDLRGFLRALLKDSPPWWLPSWIPWTEKERDERRSIVSYHVSSNQSRPVPKHLVQLEMALYKFFFRDLGITISNNLLRTVIYPKIHKEIKGYLSPSVGIPLSDAIMFFKEVLIDSKNKCKASGNKIIDLLYLKAFWKELDRKVCESFPGTPRKFRGHDR